MTDLPSLPEGYFWRIRPPGPFQSYDHLELRRVTIYGSHRIDWTVITSRSPHEVRRAAGYLTEKHFSKDAMPYDDYQRPA